ncbi:MAG: translation initiation factor IF-3 [Chloroflexi bacterium]|nr:translation initiation factor IF-3 [Chloroflexota bacterium]
MPQRPPGQSGPRVDDQIRVPEVRVIDENGEQVGVLATSEALEMARSRELNLVEVAPNAVPPVCRILDYGKFKYEEEKKERAAKKHQHTSELKELRLRPRTDDHDLQVRARAARRFLEEGHKVRLVVRFRGRESTHPEVARAQINAIAESLTDIAVVERAPEMEGRGMYAILARGKPREGAARPVGARQAPSTNSANAMTATTATEATASAS